MRKPIALAGVLLALAGCSKDEPAAEPESTEEPKAAEPAPEPVAEFDAQQTFDTVCATCHGKTGAGDGPAGAALDPKPASFSKAEFWETRDRDHIVKVIKEGGAAVGKSPLMAAYGSQYSDEQIGELADIVMGFKPEGAAEPTAE